VENASHSNFSDSSLVASYAVDAVETCWSVGVLKGDTNGTVRPRDSVIRAEGMAIVARMVQKMTTSAEQPTTTEQPTTSQETPAVHTHNWVLQEGQMRSAYTDGYRLYTCDCGETYKEVFPASRDREGWICAPENNDLHLVRKVEATTTEAGYRLYTCNNCGQVKKCIIYPITADEYASYNPNVNYSEARRAGIAYAESLGFGINEDVNWDNSGYYGSTFTEQYNSTEELISAIKKDLDFLYSETDSIEVKNTFVNCLITEWTDPLNHINKTLIASAYG
jgi:DNA-directed RNA polymerase subunit M/transcription elongation factor TFIIS